jgi:MFS family permease
MLAIGSIIGGLTGSYIAAAYGWTWINWINAIMSGVLLVVCALLLPETVYDRQQTVIESNEETSEGPEKPEARTVENAESDQFKPFTFIRSVKVGVYRGQLLHNFLSPFLTLRLPGVWMVMLQYAGLVAGIVSISTLGAQLVAAPPYLWGQNAGLINIGGILGTALGGLYTYLAVDWVVKRDAMKESHGYSEPEARLKTQLPALVLGTCGLWVFGACAASPGPQQWVGLEFGYGMLAFALMQAPSVGFNYVSAPTAQCGDSLRCFLVFSLAHSS